MTLRHFILLNCQNILTSYNLSKDLTTFQNKRKNTFKINSFRLEEYDKDIELK